MTRQHYSALDPGLWAFVFAIASGCVSEPAAPFASSTVDEQPSLVVTLSSYFPPSELNGGWRKTTDPARISALGINAATLAKFGAYNMSLPYENFRTGVSGYDPSNKASVVIKNGWIVGEYYNQASAKTGMYYLASNGKTFAMMLLGKMVAEYPALGITLDTPLYDQRWLAQGFPLSDPRKADITFRHLLGHASGIIPQVQAPIASGSLLFHPDWNFEPFTVGKDADFPATATLYYPPGEPDEYSKEDPYSSVGFNHLSLIFRNITGLEPSIYLRRKMLDPIGVGPMTYRTAPGLKPYVWATGGNNLAKARDYARLAYLLLHEGTWADKQIFSPTWIRQFTTVAGYPNINSNAECGWGAQYPKDMYRIIGSGINIAFVVPSLDLVATLNGRTPNALRSEVTAEFLRRLFASVTQTYVGCDGRVVNGTSSGARSVASLQLIDADTDRSIRPITDGMTITLADLPTRNLNVQAVTAPSLVGSVRFSWDGTANYRTETQSPYALAGDDRGNYRPWTPSVGTHVLTATPYAEAGVSGTPGTALTVRFTVR